MMMDYCSHCRDISVLFIHDQPTLTLWNWRNVDQNCPPGAPAPKLSSLLSILSEWRCSVFVYSSSEVDWCLNISPRAFSSPPLRGAGIKIRRWNPLQLWQLVYLLHRRLCVEEQLPLFFSDASPQYCHFCRCCHDDSGGTAERDDFQGNIYRRHPLSGSSDKIRTSAPRPRQALCRLYSFYVWRAELSGPVSPSTFITPIKWYFGRI